MDNVSQIARGKVSDGFDREVSTRDTRVFVAIEIGLTDVLVVELAGDFSDDEITIL